MTLDLAALLRWGPLVVLALYAGAFVAGSFRVAKKGDGRVYVLDADAIQRVSQSAFRLSFAALPALFILRAGLPSLERFAGPLEWAYSPVVQLSGLIVMAAGAAVAAVAQYQMGQAWRIGVPDQEPSHLTTRGLFRFSRNPVFLGMAAIFAGALLIAPNAITIASFSLAIFAMSIQIRREEAFLSAKIGPAYETFRARVRRWI